MPLCSDQCYVDGLALEQTHTIHCVDFSADIKKLLDLMRTLILTASVNMTYEILCDTAIRATIRSLKTCDKICRSRRRGPLVARRSTRPCRLRSIRHCVSQPLEYLNGAFTVEDSNGPFAPSVRVNAATTQR